MFGGVFSRILLISPPDGFHQSPPQAAIASHRRAPGDTLDRMYLLFFIVMNTFAAVLSVHPYLARFLKNNSSFLSVYCIELQCVRKTVLIFRATKNAD